MTAAIGDRKERLFKREKEGETERMRRKIVTKSMNLVETHRHEVANRFEMNRVRYLDKSDR